MKRARLLLLAVTLAFGFSTVLYAATKTTTLQVAAIVQSTADVNATILSFGTIVDPVLGGNHTADGFINVTMPAQQPYTITLDRGFFYNANGVATRHMAGPGFISYKLFQPDGTTEWGDNGFGNTYPDGSPLQASGTGNVQSHRVRGVTQPPSTPVASGTYSDSVQVTVHF